MKVLNLHGIYGKPNNTAYNELIKYFDNVYSPAIKYENLNAISSVLLYAARQKTRMMLSI